MKASLPLDQTTFFLPNFVIVYSVHSNRSSFGRLKKDLNGIFSMVPPVGSSFVVIRTPSSWYDVRRKYTLDMLFRIVVASVLLWAWAITGKANERTATAIARLREVFFITDPLGVEVLRQAEEYYHSPRRWNFSADRLSKVLLEGRSV